MWSGTLVTMLGTMLEPYLGLYLVTLRGFSLTGAGVVVAVMGAGSMVSQAIGGVLADAIGRRATLVLSTLATAGAILALGYARGLVGIVAAAALVGLTREMYRPASAAIVADLVSPEDRPRAFGLLYWGINLGWTAALVAGGALALQGYVLLFWVDALTCAAFGLLVWRAVPETRPAREPSSSRPERWSDVVRDRVMVTYTVVVALYTFVVLQGMTTLPLAMRGDGLGPRSFGLAIAVNGVVVVAVQPLMAGWLNRHDHVLVAATGFALVGLGYGATTVASSLWAYAVTVVVWTLGEIVATAVSLAIATDLAPPLLRGRYSGLYGVAWSAGLLLAPLGGTQLLRVGAATLWLTCLAIALVAALALVLLRPAIARRRPSMAGAVPLPR